MRMPHSSEKSNENYNIAQNGSDENKFPVTPSNPYKSRKGLMVELDMNAGLGASPIAGTKMKPTPKVIHWQELSQEEDSADEFETPAQSTFNPKKRWLREAWQNDLAKPLEPMSTVQHTNGPDVKKLVSKSYQMLSPQKQTFLPAQQKAPNSNQFNPNQMRPTVIFTASKDRMMPLINVSPVTTNHTNEPNDDQYSHSTTSKSISNPYNKTFSSPNHKQYAKPINDMQQPLILSSPNLQQQSHFDSQPNQQSDQQQPPPQNPLNDSDIETERHIVIASTPIAASSDSSNSDGSAYGKNRWESALALIELATDESSLVSTTFPLVS